ncbi:MAG: DUF1579 family protein [Emcibacteraceae bacterium]|nr:DUF1579 family protein [Emcibacteraceae bacterium]
MLKSFVIFILLFSTGFAQEESLAVKKVMAFDKIMGDWNVTQFSPDADGGWQKTTTSNITMSKSLGGNLISGTSSDIEPVGSMDLELSFTYDQVRNHYRMSVIDSSFGLMDIYEGDFNQDGNFIVTNIRSGTSFLDDEGNEFHFKFTFSIDEPDQWSYLIELTTNAGGMWSPMFKFEMTK